MPVQQRYIINIQRIWTFSKYIYILEKMLWHIFLKPKLSFFLQGNENDHEIYGFYEKHLANILYSPWHTVRSFCDTAPLVHDDWCYAWSSLRDVAAYVVKPLALSNAGSLEPCCVVSFLKNYSIRTQKNKDTEWNSFMCIAVYMKLQKISTYLTQLLIQTFFSGNQTWL